MSLNQITGSSLAADDATIIILDAGQGDSILVRLRSNQIFLIDSNWNKNRLPAALGYLEQWYKETGSADLELLCLTHPDGDHYRGMCEIIDWIWQRKGKIHNLIRSSFPNAIELRTRLRTIAASLGAKDQLLLHAGKKEYERVYVALDEVSKRIAAQGGFTRRAQDFSLIKAYSADGVKIGRLFILGPTTATVEESAKRSVRDLVNSLVTRQTLKRDSANEVSCVLWLDVGGCQILLAGDATLAALESALHQYSATQLEEFGLQHKFDLVKAAHHGASESSSPSLWDRILTDVGIVVFSAGTHEGHKHPHRKTILDIRSSRPHSTFYCTNVCTHHAPSFLIAKGPVALENALMDEFLGSAGFGSVIDSATTYHGDCKFGVARGNIEARPDRMPTDRCPLH